MKNYEIQKKSGQCSSTSLSNMKFMILIKQVEFGSIYATGSPYLLCMANNMGVNTDVTIDTSTLLHVSRHSEDKTLKPGITGSMLGTTRFLKFTEMI
jgi:hypothetical protein